MPYAPIEVFCSYAHEDEPWLRMLKAHLSLLKIGFWYDRQIRPGTDWAQDIDSHLDSASIILLLISADFFASDYCAGIEMSRAMERYKAGQARVIPIIIRHVDFRHAPFAELQMLPEDARPVKDWADHDLAFKNIAIRLREVVEEIQKSQMAISPPQEDFVPSNTTSNPPSGNIPTELDKNIQQAFSQFRHCQENVSELKTVHNTLHEIERELTGFSETVQRAVREESHQHLPDFDYIENIWQQAVIKLDYLTYFASKVMNTIEKERFSFDNDVIKGGGSWVKDLFIVQKDLEGEIRDRNLSAIKKLSKELLTKCRSNLYQIDKRLLGAVEELDRSLHRISDLIVRSRT